MNTKCSVIVDYSSVFLRRKYGNTTNTFMLNLQSNYEIKNLTSPVQFFLFYFFSTRHSNQA